MQGLVLVVHIIVCLLLIIIVLLQSGKSADLAGAFGGMGSQSTFGPRGSASFMSKMTTTLAILFMVSSLTLWIMAARKATPSSALDKNKTQTEQTETTGTTQPAEQKPAEQKPADKTDAEKAPETQPATGTDSETEKKDEAKEENK